jgi:hypothetical protein
MQSRPTSKSKLYSRANESEPSQQPALPKRLRAYPRIHQLNNDLMTIFAHCELLQSRTAQEGLRHLTAIRNAARSIAEIVGKGRVNPNGSVFSCALAALNKTEKRHQGDMR